MRPGRAKWWQTCCAVLCNVSSCARVDWTRAKLCKAVERRAGLCIAMQCAELCRLRAVKPQLAIFWFWRRLARLSWTCSNGVRRYFALPGPGSVSLSQTTQQNEENGGEKCTFLSIVMQMTFNDKYFSQQLKYENCFDLRHKPFVFLRLYMIDKDM